MIGAIEILIIVIIFGIIYSKDAIDKTFRKRPDEGVVESMTGDLQDFYKENPKRLLFLVLGSVGAIGFFIALVYWVMTRADLRRMMGFE